MIVEMRVGDTNMGVAEGNGHATIGEWECTISVTNCYGKHRRWEPRGVLTTSYTKGPWQYLGSKILQENHNRVSELQRKTN